jgi:hypothetical protein
MNDHGAQTHLDRLEGLLGTVETQGSRRHRCANVGGPAHGVTRPDASTDVVPNVTYASRRTTQAK